MEELIIQDFQAYQEAVSALYEIQEGLQRRVIELQQQNDLLEEELELQLKKEQSYESDKHFLLAPAALIIINGHGIIRSANEQASHFLHREIKGLEEESLRSLLSKNSFHDFTKCFTLFKESEELSTTIHNLQLKDKRQLSLVLRKVRNTKDAYSSSFVVLLLSIDSNFAEFSDYLGNMAIDQMHEGITITDEKGIILRVNNAFTGISGYAREQALGKTPRILKSGRHPKAFYEKMWESILHHGWWEGEIWNRRKNGQVYPEWIQINRINDPVSKKVYYMSIFSDISERKRHQERLDQLAHYDELTGLMNRRFLMTTLQLMLERLEKQKSSLALLFIDLDHFKQVNDQFGHHEGDQLLQEASQRILASVRQSDIVGRVGGDEFVVVLSRIENEKVVELIAQKIIDEVSRVYELSTSHYIGASIGIAYYPKNGRDVNDLIRHADSAMYRAKSMGRSRFALFSEEDEDILISQKEMKNLIRSAIQNPKKHLQVYYQPVYNAETNTLSSSEALVRLVDEDANIISPDRFIELAESEGFIVALGDRIFESVCIFVQGCQNKKIAFSKIAINLSVKQLAEEGLYERFEHIAHQYGVDMGMFSFEITETSAMQHISTILRGIYEFKNAGCTFMLDDFGTGYASLSQIYRLPIDVIKIDKSFTDLIESDDDSSRKLIFAIISMAKAMSIDIIVEGVESRTQVEWLLGHGVIKMQGYHFSKPLSANAFEELLRGE